HTNGFDDKDHSLDDESRSLDDEGLGLEGSEEEAVPEGQQRAAPVVETAVGQGSGSVSSPKRPERVSALWQPTLTAWINPDDAPSAVPSPIPSPMISLTVPSPIASPVATSIVTIFVDDDQFIDVGVQLELHESILHDHTQHLDAISPTLFIRFVGLMKALVFVVIDLIVVKFASVGVCYCCLSRAALQRELQEMRGRVTALEQERDRREI
nr:hypothetical protein [Tanacetum cinerariifolium]